MAVKVLPVPATERFMVTDKSSEYAEIMVQVEGNETILIIQSSYGSWSHRFCTTGDTKGVEFVSSLNRGYLIHKLLGSMSREFCGAGTVANVTNDLLRMRRDRIITKDDARTRYDDFHAIDNWKSEEAWVRFFEDYPEYEDWHELLADKECDWIEYFWKDLWLQWVDHVSSD